MSQVTTCSFFRVEGFDNKWWAFKQMRLGIYSLNKVNGLIFFKLLGSGGKTGFSTIPNFGTYVLFCVWESEQKARKYFSDNTFYKEYSERSTESFNCFAKSAEAHGLWDGQQPFNKEAELSKDKPVMVLTRATIRFKKLISFWSKVNKVSQSLEDYDGVALSIGVGEWPLIQQATLSIWKTQTEMLDYAYKNEKHKRVIKLTRQLNWYKEEMFARFVPYKLEGNWNGQRAENIL